MNNKLKVFKESFIQAMMEDYELLTELKQDEVTKHYEKAFDNLKQGRVEGHNEFDFSSFDRYVDTVMYPTLINCLQDKKLLYEDLSNNFYLFEIQTNNNKYTEENEPIIVFGGRQNCNELNTDFEENKDLNYGVIHAWYEHYNNSDTPTWNKQPNKGGIHSQCKQNNKGSISACLGVLKQLPDALKSEEKYFSLYRWNNSITYIHNNTAFVVSIKNSNSKDPKNDFRFLRTFFPIDVQKNKEYWAHIVAESCARNDESFDRNKNAGILLRYIDKSYPLIRENKPSSFKKIYSDFKNDCLLCKYIYNNPQTKRNLFFGKDSDFQKTYLRAIETGKNVYQCAYNVEKYQKLLKDFDPAQISSILHLS